MNTSTTLASLAPRVHIDGEDLFTAKKAFKYGLAKRDPYTPAMGNKMVEIAQAIVQQVAIYVDMGQGQHLICRLKANASLGKVGPQMDLWFVLAQDDHEAEAELAGRGSKKEIGPVAIDPTLQIGCDIEGCVYSKDAAARLIANALKDNTALSVMHQKCGECVQRM